MITSGQAQGPVSREKSEAAGCPIPLPASAHDVQYAWVAGDLQYCMQYVHFKAPVADCFAHARLMFSKLGRRSIPITRFRNSSQQTIPFVRQPVLICTPNGLTWRPCLKASSPPRAVVTGEQIWIDTKRGVFYFYLTD